MFSASGIVTVYDAIKKESQEKFEKMSLYRMVHVAFSVLNKAKGV